VAEFVRQRLPIGLAVFLIFFAISKSLVL